MLPPGWEEKEEEEAWYEDSSEYGEDSFEGSEDDDFLEGDDPEIADDAELEDDEESELEELIDEGEALIEEGKYEDALNLFREAQERYNESAEAACHVGYAATLIFSAAVVTSASWEDDDELANLFEEAINSFDTSLSLDPEYYPALNGLGSLHMAAGNVESAIECWQASLDADSDQEDIVEQLDEARAQTEE